MAFKRTRTVLKWMFCILLGIVLVVGAGAWWVNKMVYEAYLARQDDWTKGEFRRAKDVTPIKEDGTIKLASIIAGKEYHVPRAYLGWFLPTFSDQLLINMRWPDFSPYESYKKGDDLKAHLGNSMNMLVTDATTTTSHAFRFNVIRGYEMKSVYSYDSEYALTPIGQRGGLYGYARGTGNAGGRITPKTPTYQNGKQIENPAMKELQQRYGDVYTDEPIQNISSSVPRNYVTCNGDTQMPNPGCSLHFTEDDLLYNVTFNKIHLPEWKTIREKSIGLIKSFEAPKGQTKLDGRTKPVKAKEPEKPITSLLDRGYRIPASYMGDELKAKQYDALIHFLWPDMKPDFEEYKAQQLNAEHGNSMRIMISDLEHSTSLAYRFNVFRKFERMGRARWKDLGPMYGLQAYRLERPIGRSIADMKYPVHRNGVEVTDPTPQELKERFSTLYSLTPVERDGPTQTGLYIKCYGDTQVLKNPTCEMTFQNNGFLYSITFRKHHLPEWREIHNKSVALMANFKQAPATR